MNEKIHRARELRRKSTWAEKLVWQRLKDRKLDGFKFRRQHPVGPYVLDFYCDDLSMAIELDGSQHGLPEREEKDRVRSEYLEENGIHVLRVWNCHLRENADGVWARIRAEIAKARGMVGE